MPRLVAAAALAAALFAGCYRGPGADSPDDARPYPMGVEYQSPAPAPSGLWSTQTDGLDDCCWLARRAAFAVAIPRGATRLQANVYLPNRRSRRGTQTLAISVGDAPPHVFAGLGPGIYSLVVPLTGHVAPYRAIVHVSGRYRWNPIRRRHLAPDSRELFAELKSVRVR